MVSVAWLITRRATLAITQDCRPTVCGPTFIYRTICTKRTSSPSFLHQLHVSHRHIQNFRTTHRQSFFIAPPTTPFLLNPSQQRVTASPLSESDCQHLKAILWNYVKISCFCYSHSFQFPSFQLSFALWSLMPTSSVGLFDMFKFGKFRVSRKPN